MAETGMSRTERRGDGPPVETTASSTGSAKPSAKAQIRLLVSKLSWWQRTSLAVIAVAIVTGIIWLVAWSRQPEYALLFGDLAPEDAASIVDQLKEQKVPYKVSASGTRLEVEESKARDLRLSFVGQGLPSGGKSKGFELFDELKLGATNFVENLNYRRALEAELARTIVRFNEVAQSRVHLVIPRRSLYWEKEESPTASVWVKLRGSSGLERHQVKAIVQLVAGAVEGLTPSNVTVVDSLGQILTEEAMDPATGLTQAQLATRREAEKSFESKIVSLLQPVVGEGKVRARVSVTMNFDEVSQQQESYDPTEQVLRSEQDLNEESGNVERQGGVPGTQSNLGTAESGSTNEQNYLKRAQRTRNYEIGKTVRTVVEHPGEITRISAAVIVDDKTITKETDGGVEYEHEPRSTTEISKCTDIVMKAIGYQKDRGDSVVVENLSFDRSQSEEQRIAMAEGRREELWTKVLNASRTPLIVLSLLLVFMFVIKPLMKGIIVRSEPVLSTAAALSAGVGATESLEAVDGSSDALEGKTIEELEAELLHEGAPGERISKRDVLARRINQIAESDIDNVVQLVRTWMDDRRGA